MWRQENKSSRRRGVEGRGGAGRLTNRFVCAALSIPYTSGLPCILYTAARRAHGRRDEHSVALQEPASNAFVRPRGSGADDDAQGPRAQAEERARAEHRTPSPLPRPAQRPWREPPTPLGMIGIQPSHDPASSAAYRALCTNICLTIRHAYWRRERQRVEGRGG